MAITDSPTYWTLDNVVGARRPVSGVDNGYSGLEGGNLMVVVGLSVLVIILMIIALCCSTKGKKIRRWRGRQQQQIVETVDHANLHTVSSSD